MSMRWTELGFAYRRILRRLGSITIVAVIVLWIAAAYVSFKASSVPFAWVCLASLLLLLYLGSAT